MNGDASVCFVPVLARLRCELTERANGANSANSLCLQWLDGLLNTTDVYYYFALEIPLRGGSKITQVFECNDGCASIVPRALGAESALLRFSFGSSPG